MKLSELDYVLPPELIAQHPAKERTASRLLVVDRKRGAIEHSVFAELGRWLRAGDLLVLNNTKVKPVRLFARRPRTGAIVEVFVLEERGEDGDGLRVRAMLGSNARLTAGEVLEVPDAMMAEVPLTATLGDKHADGTWEVVLRHSGLAAGAVGDVVGGLARMPLPPYIKRERFGDADAPEDRERYQTVYASVPGAVAAPTAGLHFTSGLLGELEGAGVGHTFLTLHVGPGTFKPVKTETLEAHVMHAEEFELPAECAGRVNEARAAGGRVVSVGTTTTRVLESCAAAGGSLEARSGITDLLIQPGHQWRAVDALITNFHLPKLTLLALVMAFAGRELVLEAYRSAIEQRYRFFSYGDAMLIL